MGTNDGNKKIELFSLPNEILTQIFVNLKSHRDFLSVSHVCKSFAAIAEVAFEQKYSDRTFRVWGPNRIGVHKVMLSKYGEKVSKIVIENVNQPEFLDLVEKKCCNLTSVKLISVPRILNVTGLKEVKLDTIPNMSKEELRNFIENNQQLETFEHISRLDLNNIRFQTFDWAELLHNRLSMLKKLELNTMREKSMINIPKITLQSLEELNLRFTNPEFYIQFLRVLDCPKLKKLNFLGATKPNNDFITEIIQFKTLSMLDLIESPVTVDQMEMLAKHLPNLTEFATNLVQSEVDINSDEIESKILSVLSILPNLTKLRANILLNERFYNELQRHPLNEFHNRISTLFPDVEVIVHVDRFSIILSTSRDRIYVYCGNISVELHWMDNFNETNIRNLIPTLFDLKSNHLKFVNHCEDNLDISIFPWEMEFINTLDITSKGPLSIDPNISSRRSFFPYLDELIIHLENHTAIDFLNSLHPDFCAHIRRLSIDTKTIDEHEKTDYENEMKRIFGKFPNLIDLLHNSVLVKNGD